MAFENWNKFLQTVIADHERRHPKPERNKQTDRKTDRKTKQTTRKKV